MTLTSGTRFGAYDVLSPLGRGGMGEVWRARDSRLGREVALKTLPAEFATDPDRLARFEREARLLASLNHPHIGGIHGLEEAGGTIALVLELVEGDTLADRLAEGALPAAEALRLAVQICTALEAAHEKGIVHRDLKPANIKITPEGTVKVLDFGLAKAFEGREADPARTDSSTLSLAATQTGIILGTAGYMSPEQASAGASDKRADIWAFGVVLFEMLTGGRVFGGETVSHVLAAVLAKDPAWNSLPPNLHPRLRELLERCLQKKPSDRYRDIGDVRADLERVLADPQGALVTPAPQTAAGHAKPGLRAILPWVAATAAVCLVVAGAAGWFLRPAPAPEPGAVGRFSFPLPEGQSPNSPAEAIAISRDGTQVAYAASGRLHLRRLHETEARPVPGTETAGLAVVTPAFSPDGQWLAYIDVITGTRSFIVKRIPVTGGTPVRVFESMEGLNGLSWPTPDTMLFAAAGAGIVRIPAKGGAADVLVQAVDGELLNGPQLLPGGGAVLFSRLPQQPLAPNRWDAAQIVVQSVGGDDRTVVLEGGSAARHVPTGHLVYAQGATLFALAFDLESRTISGGAVPLVDGVQRSSNGLSDTANYALSDTGTLVSIPGTGGVVAEPGVLALVDRTGAVSPLPVRPGQYRSPRISPPDGRQLAVEVLDGAGQGHIWIYDLSGQSQLRRLTQTGTNTRPIWTPDGMRVTFASQRDGAWGIYEQPADGSAVAERLLEVEQGPAYPESWSPDGRTLAFTDATTAGEWTIWTVARDGGMPELLAGEAINHLGAVFSPDGRWVAYTAVDGAAGAGSAVGIRVRPFPRTGVFQQITQDGEVWPVWSADGTELFFRLRRDTGLPVQLMGLDVSTQGTFTFRNPRDVPIQGALMYQNYRDFDLAPDGQQFVMVVPPPRTAAGPDTAAASPGGRIDIVINWVQELRALLPVH